MSEIPNLPFICSRKDCTLPVEFQPVARIWAEGYSRSTDPIIVPMCIGLCESHKNGSSLDDFNPENLYELCCRITKAMKKAKPDRNTLELMWKLVKPGQEMM